jgi:hypothetical protein
VDNQPSLGALGPVFWICFLAILVFYCYCGWKLYVKAGKPGWASLIPIYNTVVLLDIVGKPIWWIILLLIPFVNIIVGIIVIHRLSLAFGKGVGFTLGLIILGFIFYPILALGSATYRRPA